MTNLVLTAILAAAVFATSIAEGATDPNCFPRSRVAEAFERDFEVVLGGHRYQHCDLDNFPYLTAKAILMIRDLSSSEFDGSSIFVEGIIRTTPLDFLNSRIKKIYLGHPGDRVCDGSLDGHHDARERDAIRVCPSSAKDRSAFHVASVIMHEAKHFDGNPHVSCNRRKFMGSSEACDESTRSYGAYATEIEFAIGALRTSVLNDSEKSDVRERTRDSLRWRFNALPGDLKEGAALVLNSGELAFYDGKKITKMASRVPRGTIAQVAPNGVLRFITADPTKYYEYAFDGEIKSAKNRIFPPMDSEMASKFRDFEKIGDMRCILYSDYLTCAGPEGFERPKHIKIPGAAGLSFMRSNQAVRWFGLPMRDVAFILTGNGRAIPIPSDWESMSSARTLPIGFEFSARAAVPWFGPRLVPYILKLNRQGQVTLLEFGKDEKPAPGLESTHVSDLVGPLVWSESLDQI